MRRLIRQRALAAPGQKLLHPPRFRKTFGLDVLVKIRRAHFTMRYSRLATFDQGTRPPSTHAQAAPSIGVALLSHFLVSIYDGRVAHR